MRTSTWIAVTDIMSAAYVSPLIQIYLFIRTYMSALVDMIQDYKKMKQKNAFFKNPVWRHGSFAQQAAAMIIRCAEPTEF